MVLRPKVGPHALAITFPVFNFICGTKTFHDLMTITNSWVNLCQSHPAQLIVAGDKSHKSHVSSLLFH